MIESKFGVCQQDPDKLPPRLFRPVGPLGEKRAQGANFFFIGGFDRDALSAARARGEPDPAPHTSTYAPTPEPAIRTGVQAMALAVLGVVAKAPLAA